MPTLFEPTTSRLVRDGPDLVILVGMPGCGKSSFIKKHLLPMSYVVINRDTLKTPEKCLAAATEALAAGRRVAIDNTSPSRESRAPYIQLANIYNVPPRCLYFDVDRPLACHMDAYRSKKTKVPRIPKVAYNIYVSKFQMPSVDEGLSELLTIHFIPDFDTLQQRDAFLIYYDV